MERTECIDASLEQQFIDKYGLLKIGYGTAGFRTHNDKLEMVGYRLGQFVSILTNSLDCNKVLGIMITASHNQIDDNGFKIINVNGEMLDTKYEPLVYEFCNNIEHHKQEHKIETLKQELLINQMKERQVFIGWDTRPSSESLRDLVVKGIQNMGCKVIDFGKVITPQLHYYVYLNNKDQKHCGQDVQYYLEHYQSKVISNFNNLVGQKEDNKLQKLVVDCANGVGAIQLQKVQTQLNIQTELINYDQFQYLNHKCGSEYVQKEKKVCTGIEQIQNEGQSLKCCSFDGDCDRIIYYQFNKDTQKLDILEGDKIMVLYLKTLQKLLINIDLDLTIGVIQTAYANGASTYILNQIKQEMKNIEIVVAPTGVKYLHKEAVQYDIGVYFESNGHGTIIANQKIVDYLENNKNSSQEINRLHSFIELSNMQTGDGIANLLMIEAGLYLLDYSLQYLISIYSDLANVQVKIQVKDKSRIINNYQETMILEPKEIQEGIDSVVQKYKDQKARAFVRPSGTEDVVRLYVEAQNQQVMETISQQIQQIIIENKVIN